MIAVSVLSHSSLGSSSIPPEILPKRPMCERTIEHIKAILYPSHFLIWQPCQPLSFPCHRPILLALLLAACPFVRWLLLSPLRCPQRRNDAAATQRSTRLVKRE